MQPNPTPAITAYKEAALYWADCPQVFDGICRLINFLEVQTKINEANNKS